MKPITLLSVVAMSFFAALSAQAQHPFEQWNGGSGTWDAGTTADWNGNQTYVNSISRDNTVTPEVAYDYFGSAPGTVTIDNSTSSTPVTTGIMEFNSGGQAGNWVFQGDALSDIAEDSTATVVQIDGGQTANVTFNNTINIAPNPTNGGSVFFNGGNGTTLTLDHINISSTPITFTDANGPHIAESAPYIYNNGNQSFTVQSQTPLFYAANGNTIVINTITTDPGLFTGMVFGNYGDASMATGTYIITGALLNNINGGKQFDFGSGNIVLETSSTGTGPMVFVGAGANLLQTILTSGSQTISNVITNQGSANAEIGGKTADLSTYTGVISAAGGGELDLHAAANGRVVFTADVGSGGNSTSSDGAGTVVMSNAGGNDYSSSGANAFEVKEGTLLIKNTSGTAFGSTAGLNVLVDAGATLGGTGISTQKIVAVAATSKIAAGDAGQTNLGINPSIGTLNLAGGLTAANGLTMDFKFNGVSNDQLVVGTQFSLSGVISMNLINLGNSTLSLLTPYTLATGSGTWTDLGAVFATTAQPDGYIVNTAYGVNGYLFDASTDTLTTEFIAVPEPSTYAMMLGALALLGFCLRRKSALLS